MNEEKQKSYENSEKQSREIQDVFVEQPKNSGEKMSASKEQELSTRSAEQARADIDRLGLATDDISSEDLSSKEQKDDSVRWTSKELTVQTYERTLTAVRNRLSKPEKTLSKVVHQPIIEKTSDVMGQTIVRPSGILFGGVFSFIGSLSAYLLAKRLGGEMPYSVFGAFFIGGFILGLIVELSLTYFKKRKNK